MMYNDTMIEQESNLGRVGRSNQASLIPNITTSKSLMPLVNIIMIIVSCFRLKAAGFLIDTCRKLENFFSLRACCFLNSESIICNKSYGITHP